MVNRVYLYDEFGIQRPAGAYGLLDQYVQECIPLAEQKRLRPAVLIIPGGGYDHVSAREGKAVAMRFLAAGWQAFVLRYSVAPVQFPHPLREAAMAMAYIRQNAAMMGVAPTMVAAIGFSAGGHLCGMLGTMYDSEVLADIAPASLLRPDVMGLNYPVAVSWGNTHEGSFRNLCGDRKELRHQLSLDRLARADMPPVFLWHTRDDESVPCRNTILLAERLIDLGVDCAMHIYHHGLHGLSTADEQSYPAGEVPSMSSDVPEWLDLELAFFRELGLK